MHSDIYRCTKRNVGVMHHKVMKLAILQLLRFFYVVHYFAANSINFFNQSIINTLLNVCLLTKYLSLFDWSPLHFIEQQFGMQLEEIGKLLICTMAKHQELVSVSFSVIIPCKPPSWIIRLFATCVIMIVRKFYTHICCLHLQE